MDGQMDVYSGSVVTVAWVCVAHHSMGVEVRGYILGGSLLIAGLGIKLGSSGLHTTHFTCSPQPSTG